MEVRKRPFLLYALIVIALTLPVSGDAQKKSRKAKRAKAKPAKIVLTKESRAFRKRVEVLVRKSRGVSKRCNRFFETAKKRGWLDTRKRTFRSRKDLSEAIEIAKKYPGTPKSTHQALGMLISKVPRGVDKSWLITQTNQLENCQKLAAFQVFSKLIASADDFALKGAPRKNIIRLVRNQLRKETRQPNTLVSVMTQLGLAEKLIEHRLVRVGKNTSTGLAKLAKDVDLTLDRMRKKYRRARPTRILGDEKDVIAELREANRLRRRLNRIVKRI